MQYNSNITTQVNVKIVQIRMEYRDGIKIKIDNIGLVSLILFGWELRLISPYYMYKSYHSCLLRFLGHPYILHSSFYIKGKKNRLEKEIEVQNIMRLQ